MTILSDTARASLTPEQAARVERLLELSARHEPIIRLRRLLRTQMGIVVLQVTSELLDRERTHRLKADGSTEPLQRGAIVGPLECLQDFGAEVR